MRFDRISIFAVLLFISSGCQTARVEQPLTATFAGNEPEAQLDFWHQLTERPVTSNDDAFHGVLLFLDGTDPGADYAARVDAMKTRGLLPQNFDRPADESVTRGALAVVIVKAMKIKGGVMLHLTGDWSRYAVRELMFLNIYPPSTPNQTFSGSEFIGIIGRLEDWQRGQRADAPAKLLPGQLE